MGNAQTRQYDAHRRGSVAWNFRYPTLRSNRRDSPIIMVFDSKMSITDWLDLLDMQRYESNFHTYNGVEDLLDLKEIDLKRLGISSPKHRSKMLDSLVGLQAKRRQSMNIEVSTLPHTMPKRNNSCTPIHLSEFADTLNEETSECKFDSVRKSGKRLTWSDVNSVYETKSLSIDTAEQNMESRSSPKNGSIANLAFKTSSKTPLTTSPSPASSGSSLSFPSMSALNTNEQQEAIALKKALEWELSLDSRDLRSHAWYHGPLPRQRAEEIVQREGDFLVRDCTSQPDNYVLTCRARNTVLHFVINKILLQPETVYERVQYQFEEDAFDAVPDLITFYVGSGKPISAASGARIQFPCNRYYPLSFYGHKIVGNQLHTQMLAGIRGASPLNSPMGGNNCFRFSSNSAQLQANHQQQQMSPIPLSSPPRVKGDIPPRLPSKKQRSQSLTPVQAKAVSNIKNSETSNSADGVIQACGTGTIVNNDNIDEETDADGPQSLPPNGIHGSQRRFSNFERSSDLQAAFNGRSNQLNGSTFSSNGFQTIARCSAATHTIDQVKFTTHSLPRAATAGFRGHVVRTSSLAREFNLGESLAQKFIPEESPEKPPSPPPKPVRTPGVATVGRHKDIAALAEQQQHALQRAAVAAASAAGYQASGSDSGNGSGDSVQSSLPNDTCDFNVHRGVIIKNPRFMSNSASSATLKSLMEFDVAAAEELLFTLDIPEFKAVSKFDIENFSTLLLPSVENKPLDGDALGTFKIMLLETGPKVIAEHMTRIDIGLLIEDVKRNNNNENEKSNENRTDKSNGNRNGNSNSYLHTAQIDLDCCGLEMLTLPQGAVFRKDLVERTQCIKLMVAVTILTCQSDLDRAELLSKWIQIAVETKTALGNLFGFCSIMLGLCMPQVQRLDKAWHILRQEYTDSAFTFEAKLRPTLISMNECSNPQAPNTTVPHVLIYVLLKDRPVIDIINTNSNTMEKSSLYSFCITSWESKADDFGMGINYLHLDSARGFLKSLTLYRKNAKTILEDSNSRLDELLCDAFRTEFHVKFLWGSSGATASAEDRHEKLEKVLTLMADKFCSADENTIGA